MFDSKDFFAVVACEGVTDPDEKIFWSVTSDFSTGVILCFMSVDGEEIWSKQFAIMFKNRVFDVKLRPMRWKASSKGLVFNGVQEQRTAIL